MAGVCLACSSDDLNDRRGRSPVGVCTVSFASCSLPLSWVHIELVASFLLCSVPTEEAGVGPVTLGFFKNSGRVEEVVSGSWMARWDPQAVVATPVLSKYLWNS